MKDETAAAARLTKQLEKRLKRRGYIRKMMQQYRQKEKLELVFLRTQAEQLETEVKGLLDRGFKISRYEANEMLSWKEVATALLTEKRLAVSQQRALAEQVEEVEELAREMHKWVALHKSIPISPRGCGTWTDLSSWRHVTLFSNPRSRELGKEWITRHMFTNTEAMMRAHGFPSLDVPFFEDTDVHFTADDGHYVLVRRSQYEITTRLPPALQCLVFRNHICDALVINGLETPEAIATTVKETTRTTTLHQMINMRDEAVNLLCGQFQDGDHRHVVVAQQIQDDELWSHDQPQRNRMMWFERTTLPGSTRSVVRMLYIMHQAKLPRGGYEPLDEDAREWGGDLRGLSLPMQEVKSREGSIMHGMRLSRMAQERFQIIVGSIMMRRPGSAE
ncbi:Aste57867_8654 [Aphanomyces stellatus]|uniref:Aste57867_8654 protein n=1 Tax=Aphanomyces stellatus TaxID=120398 RepID=A0A485KKV9_9STRA|nr:hypothetical protein As57867_008620 [Aphanomyces stellatus]VFT85540.1 Aste57867_8654 [Aphanomyces stellatus]